MYYLLEHRRNQKTKSKRIKEDEEEEEDDDVASPPGPRTGIPIGFHGLHWVHQHIRSTVLVHPKPRMSSFNYHNLSSMYLKVDLDLICSILSQLNSTENEIATEICHARRCP